MWSLLLLLIGIISSHGRLRTTQTHNENVTVILLLLSLNLNWVYILLVLYTRYYLFDGVIGQTCMYESMPL